jgi:hypothetical protein
VSIEALLRVRGAAFEDRDHLVASSEIEGEHERKTAGGRLAEAGNKVLPRPFAQCGGINQINELGVLIVQRQTSE